jgi:hypothetical protein
MAFVRISRMPLPQGCPGQMRQAARRARVAEALGSALARHLIDVLPAAGGGFSVVLAGVNWEPARAEIERCVSRVLGASVTLVGRPVAPSARAAAGTGSRVESAGNSTDPAERLRRAAERLLRRRAGA